MRHLVNWYFFFFMLLIINFFFYSLITITIYKLLCFNVDYFIFNVYKLKKKINIFFFSQESNIFYFSSLTHYSNINYYYNILQNNELFYITKLSNIKSFFFTNINSITMTHSLFFLNHLISLSFFIRSSNFLWVDIISLQKTLLINLGETGVFFFRMFNPTHLNLKLITIYIVYPNESSIYLNKIQCFCYNLMFLYSLETIDLPVLFFIDHMFIYFYDMLFYNHFFLYYITFFN